VLKTDSLFPFVNLTKRSRDSSVSIVARLWEGRSGFDSRQGQGLYFFATAPRPNLGPTQPPNQWVQVVPSPEVKLTTQIHVVPRLRMHGAILPLPHTSPWCGAVN
jgi:hypothetical protein